MGQDPAGPTFIRQYAGKGINGATAGLAYNLGLAHGDITAAGLRNEDVDTTGPADYDFTDRAVYNAGTNNLAKYTHHKVLINDPQTNVA